jgi:hypothetical protein
MGMVACAPNCCRPTPMSTIGHRTNGAPSRRFQRKAACPRVLLKKDCGKQSLPKGENLGWGPRPNEVVASAVNGVEAFAWPNACESGTSRHRKGLEPDGYGREYGLRSAKGRYLFAEMQHSKRFRNGAIVENPTSDYYQRLCAPARAVTREERKPRSPD